MVVLIVLGYGTNLQIIGLVIILTRILLFHGAGEAGGCGDVDGHAGALVNLLNSSFRSTREDATEEIIGFLIAVASLSGLTEVGVDSLAGAVGVLAELEALVLVALGAQVVVGVLGRDRVVVALLLLERHLFLFEISNYNSFLF